MAEAIRMPLLSDTMKEGVIAEWHKKVGDEVKADDVIADVETDKATMEVNPYVDGTLLYIAVDKGQGVPVNGIMAIIGKPGEDFQSLLDGEKQAAPAAKKEETPTAPAQNVAPAAPASAAQQPAAEPAASAAPKKEEAQPTPVQNAAPAAPVQAPQEPTAATPQAAAEKEEPKAGAGAATVVRMPLLSDTMKEGKIVAWHKKVGDMVKSDDVIADVETDKATMEVMPYADGTLLYIGVKEGEAAKINDIIAIVGKAGTDVTPYLDGGAPAQAGTNAPAATEPAAPKQTESQSQPEPAHDSDERVKASPLAKMLAGEKGIDLHQLKGSGDNGRIIKRDIDTYQPKATPVAAPSAAAPAATPAQSQEQPQPQKTAKPAAPVAVAQVVGQEGHTDVPLTQMRKIIANKLSESKFTAPHFYLNMTIIMDKAIESRKAMNEVSPIKISFNDLVVKACAMALRRHPQVNSSWMGEFIRQNHHIHIGTAVAVDEGLIVPVVKFADQKSLSQISQEASMLIEKARTKKIQPPEFTGNTFTISNLGMMDIDDFTAIINPPDACILAVGKITPSPVVENGEIVVRQLMKITLSCDHRVVDGAVGSRFLQTLKQHLENPVTMLV